MNRYRSKQSERESERRLERLNRRRLRECDKCGCNLCPGCDFDHDCFAAEREASEAAALSKGSV